MVPLRIGRRTRGGRKPWCTLDNGDLHADITVCSVNPFAVKCSRIPDNSRRANHSASVDSPRRFSRLAHPAMIGCAFADRRVGIPLATALFRAQIPLIAGILDRDSIVLIWTRAALKIVTISGTRRTRS